MTNTIQTPWKTAQKMPVWLVALALMLAPSAPAQTTTGTISGTVTDPSGRVVAGARVSVTNEVAGEARSATSAATGDFSFPSLLPATYTIRIEAAGFQAFVSKGNILTPNARLAVGELRLTVGSVAETVEVEAQTAQVATSSAENSALLTRDQFSMIPTKGRDLTNLLRLLPGVQMTGDQETFGGATGFGATIGSVQGTRSAQQNLTVDGIAANDLGAPAGLSGQVNMDAVQEVRVLLSNYQAEYGRNPGAQISMTTRSGTKDFHGGAYYYNRNDVFNSNDFFRNRSAITAFNSKPALYRFHTMGATLGGPVTIPKINSTRDKLFFFYSFDKTLSRIPDAGGGLGVGQPSITRYNQPTALERIGDFSQSAVKPNDPITGKPFLNNVILPDRINRDGQTLLNVYPLPNVPNNGSWNYETLRLLKIPNFQHVFRIDDRITANDTLYVRGAVWHKDTYGAGGTVLYGTTPIWPFLESHYEYTDDSLAVNYTHVWSPKIISEFTAGARHSTEGETKDDFAALQKKGSRGGLGLSLGYLFPAPHDNPRDLIPNVVYTGVLNPTTVGFGTRFGNPGGDTGFDFTHSTTFVLNSHTLKAGLYWNRGRDIEGRFGLANGQFDFGVDRTNPLDSGNAFANQLLGNFRNYLEVNTREPVLLLRTITEAFVQDTWKVNRKLTFDYGIRFSHTRPFDQTDDKGSIFDPTQYVRANAPRQYVPAIVNGVRVGRDSVTGQTVSAALISAFVPGTGNIANGIVKQTDAGVPRGFLEAKKLLVMPRFGFAYDPFGDGKTAIRGGAGVFYQTEDDGFFVGQAMVTNPPYILTANAFNANISQLGIGLGSIFPANVIGLDRSSTRPATYNFSLGVQRDIGGKTILDVKYVGSLSRHLGGRRNINTIPFATRFLPQNIDPTASVANTPFVDNLLRPYPGYGNIIMAEKNLSSNYHSLQATMNRRFARGFQFGVAYTYSKAMDYGSDERANTTPQYLSYGRIYGKSTFDQTHILVANWQYDIPALNMSRGITAATKGWQLSGIGSFSSGIPLAITQTTTTGADLLGGGGGADGQRVNLTCNPNQGHFDKTVDAFFNTACISFAGRGDIGNAPKDAVRGPGRSNFDMTLFRNFNLGSDQRTMTFRWEVYNIFNHTQFNSIDTVARFNPATGAQVNPTFGQALGALPARQMQLSLRFKF